MWEGRKMDIGRVRDRCGGALRMDMMRESIE